MPACDYIKCEVHGKKVHFSRTLHCSNCDKSICMECIEEKEQGATLISICPLCSCRIAYGRADFLEGKVARSLK